MWCVVLKCGQVGEWLRDLQLEQYRDLFAEHGVDGEKLLGISDVILAETLRISSKLHRCVMYD